MFPVFSLVLDKDVTSEIAMTFPELYKELMKVIEISTVHTKGITDIGYHLYLCT